MSLASLSRWQRIKRRWAPSAYKHPDGTIELDFEIAAGIDPFQDSEEIKKAKLQRYYARQHFWRKVSGTAFVSVGVFWLGKHMEGSISEVISRMSLYEAFYIGGPIALGLWILFDDNT